MLDGVRLVSMRCYRPACSLKRPIVERCDSRSICRRTNWAPAGGNGRNRNSFGPIGRFDRSRGVSLPGCMSEVRVV